MIISDFYHKIEFGFGVKVDTNENYYDEEYFSTNLESFGYTDENEKNRKLKQLEWALSVGIKHSQLRLYGYTFLKENPEVIETLKVMNTKIKQSDEEAALVKKKWYDNHKEKVKKYQREYKIKNADAIKEKAKQWREANQEHIKEYRKKYKENNLVI